MKEKNAQMWKKLMALMILGYIDSSQRSYRVSKCGLLYIYYTAFSETLTLYFSEKYKHN